MVHLVVGGELDKFPTNNLFIGLTNPVRLVVGSYCTISLLCHKNNDGKTIQVNKANKAVLKPSRVFFVDKWPLVQTPICRCCQKTGSVLGW